MQLSLRFGVAVEIAHSVNPLPDSPRGDPSTKEVENMKWSVSLGRLALMAGIVLLGILSMSSLAAAQSTISGQVKDTGQA